MSRPPERLDPNAATLHAYGQAMDRWLEASSEEVGGMLLAFLEQVVAMTPAGGSVLEIGSGSGRDADWLEAHGLTVRRTDGCPEFVSALRSRGTDAQLLDVLRDPVPTGCDLVYASGVLLHLEADDLPAVLDKLAAAAPRLAFSVKVGEGSAWSTAKTGLPRFFQYWTEDSLRTALAATPWQVDSLEQQRGRYDDWLLVFCRTG